MDAKTLVLSLVLTCILYAIFPVLIALFTRKPTTEKKYRRLSFILNILIVILCFALFSNGGNVSAYNFAPYLIWTSVAVMIGKSILRSKNLLADAEGETRTTTASGSERARGSSETGKSGETGESGETAQTGNYRCSVCHAYHSEWHQTCPICGAFGKIQPVSAAGKSSPSSSESARVMLFCAVCGYTGSAAGTSKSIPCPKCGRSLRKTNTSRDEWAALSKDEKKALFLKWKNGSSV